MTFFVNGLLFASAALVFFLSIQINKIIKKRFDLIEAYKKDLYKYRDLLTEYLNFINQVENDIRQLDDFIQYMKNQEQNQDKNNQDKKI